uniref:Uncharacterized protein n=1 Tax=Opuntia streptacantha TaxID=393608 RepID=A0A7C8Z892_OPUST
MGSRRAGSVDEEAKLGDKHQVLLQEYLVLQKECISKKRKLKEAKERKEALLGEIRFLRHRCSFLIKIQSQNAEQQLIAAQSQKTDAKYDVEPSGQSSNAYEYTFKDPTFQNSQLIRGSMWNSSSVGKEVSFPSLRTGNKPKDLFTNSKRAEKRKISWQDQVALKG